MTDRGPATAKAEVTIGADPAKVYGLITDLPTLASLAEENEAMEWRKGDKVSPGAVFKGTNRNGFAPLDDHVHRHRRRSRPRLRVRRQLSRGARRALAL